MDKGGGEVELYVQGLLLEKPSPSSPSLGPAGELKGPGQTGDYVLQVTPESSPKALHSFGPGVETMVNPFPHPCFCDLMAVAICLGCGCGTWPLPFG